MVLVPAHQPEDVPSNQSCYPNMDGEWILDHDGKHILWIPADERHQSWTNRYGKVIVVKTGSGRTYVIGVHHLETWKLNFLHLYTASTSHPHASLYIG